MIQNMAWNYLYLFNLLDQSHPSFHGNFTNIKRILWGQIFRKLATNSPFLLSLSKINSEALQLNETSPTPSNKTVNLII